MCNFNVTSRWHYQVVIINDFKLCFSSFLFLFLCLWGTVTQSHIPSLSYFLLQTEQAYSRTPICVKTLQGWWECCSQNLTCFRSLSSGTCSSKEKGLGSRIQKAIQVCVKSSVMCRLTAHCRDKSENETNVA